MLLVYYHRIPAYIHIVENYQRRIVVHFCKRFHHKNIHEQLPFLRLKVQYYIRVLGIGTFIYTKL